MSLTQSRGHISAVLTVTLVLALSLLSRGADKKSQEGSALYKTTNVLSAYFTFSRDDWQAMEPAEREGRNGSGMRGAGGGPRLIGPIGGRNGLSATRGIEFNYVHAQLEVQGTKFEKVAVRYKGNGTYFRSAGSLKRSLKVDLNEFEKGKKLDGVTKLNFHSNVSDPTWMLEPLSYQLYRDAGVPSPRTAYVKVYVTVPGLYRRRYMGLYSLVENIDRHFIQDNFHEKGGAIFKPVGPNLFGYLGEDWSKYQQQYDPKTDLTPAQQKRMIEFCRLISAEPELEFRDRIKGFIDLDEFARFMAMTVCLSSMDSILAMGQNFYVYLHPKSNRFVFIPWDLDNSFGKFRMTGSQEERETLSIEEPWVGSNRFLERMFRVPEFKKLYLARLKEFTDGIFKPERIRKQVEELGVILRPAVRDESPQKLELFDRGLAGDSVPPALDDRGGFRAGGGGFASSPIKPINPFMKARSLSLEEQLAGRSLGSTISSKRNFGPGR